MSTLLADTIRKTGGTAGVDIRIKNTSVYESDGGTSVTQNLVQGVLKAWVRIAGTGTAAIDDSFNCGSLTDNGTGDYNVSRTNNMSHVNYYVIDGQYVNAGYTAGAWYDGTTTTATVQYKVFDGNSTSSAADRDPVGYSVIGDLA
tara:strand:+ start:34 stop:468 length:435 start_codon:yes stop_codon:yes gene_type:complete